jgi:hypothetical protein
MVYKYYKIEIKREEPRTKLGLPTYYVQLKVQGSERAKRMIEAKFIDNHYVITKIDLHQPGSLLMAHFNKEVLGVVDNQQDLEDKMHAVSYKIAKKLLDYDDEMYGRWTESCIEDKVGSYQMKLEIR